MNTIINKQHSQQQRGFTIVELLIVIVVIAILAAISIVAYNGIQTRSLDTKREQDMVTIEKAIKGYDALYGGVPVTSAFGGAGPGDWNNSSMSSWLSFLRKDFGHMPVDSKNSLNGSSDASSGITRVYFYYCYQSSSIIEPNMPTVRLGYHKENSATVWRDMIVQNCLNSVPSNN